MDPQPVDSEICSPKIITGSKPEHRFRYAETPKGTKSVVWYWWLNPNQEEWAGHVERYADAGFTLKHSTAYQRPDGRTIYDGVWHKVVD